MLTFSQNKANRAKTREVVTLKKNTGGGPFNDTRARRNSNGIAPGLEAEIHRLQESSMSSLIYERFTYQPTPTGNKGDLDKNGQEKLASLREEVDRIKTKKAEYVAAHPEHAKLVYPGGTSTNNGAARTATGQALPGRNLFGPNGLPLHPERSIYYDAVMNPFGVAPPGMPYAERRELSTLRCPFHQG